jgi:hypothetical protein
LPCSSSKVQCRISWPRTVTRTRLLSWGWSASQSLANSCAPVPIGLARSPLVVPHLNVEALRWLDPEEFTPPPGPAIRKQRGILSQASTPLQSFTDVTPHRAGHPNRNPTTQNAAPSEVQSPSTYSQPRRATFPGSPTYPGLVAPLGFRTLSTPCSRLGLPGLFHPGPALGVLPSRLSSLDTAVRSFERRLPLGVGPVWPKPPVSLLQGSTRCRDHAQTLGS